MLGGNRDPWTMINKLSPICMKTCIVDGIMALRLPRVHAFAAKAERATWRCLACRQTRQFTACSKRQTDGVFRALTENRVQVPW